MTQSNDDKPTWRPEACEPGIPEQAPESAVLYALALDRLTGGSGSWVALKKGDES